MYMKGHLNQPGITLRRLRDSTYLLLLLKLAPTGTVILEKEKRKK